MYIQLYQLHGLIRSKDLELGIDEDTGGQIIYIIELAKALADLAEVSRVEIVTRLFKDNKHPGYSLSFEQLNEKVGIVRVPCGPSKYLNKVDLWNYLDEFVENINYYIESDEKKPDIVHSHYGDAGYVCNKISQKLGIPHVFTAHSLGKPKLEELKLLKEPSEDLEHIYNFTKRINIEQEIINQANALIISCDQERHEQFSKYDVSLEDTRFKVIVPGVNHKRFRPFWENIVPKDDKSLQVRDKLQSKLKNNLIQAEKPCILMLSRLEVKKNISNMVECYIDDQELQNTANLIICAGKIHDKSKLNAQQLSIINHIEKLIETANIKDKIYLFDEVSYENEVPELYKIVGQLGGVFVDCDMTDPLPLTVLEAALTGIPVVANPTCSLASIISKGSKELLVNMKKHRVLSNELIKLFNNKDYWEFYSKRGVEFIINELTWDLVAKRVLNVYEETILQATQLTKTRLQ